MNIIANVKDELYGIITQAITQGMEKGKIPQCEIPNYVLELPRDKNHGDYATNVVMLMTKLAKMNPRVLAEAIVEEMDFTNTSVASVEIAGPGFLNFRLKEGWLYPLLEAIQTENEDYGRSDFGQGEKVQVEFVSANPTGLLHMGNARGGSLGDLLARVLNMAGYQADKEYYINDAGNQVRNLALSVEARSFEALGVTGYEVPEDGYQGEDIKSTAKRLLELKGESLASLPREERLAQMLDVALAEKVGGLVNKACMIVVRSQLS